MAHAAKKWVLLLTLFLGTGAHGREFAHFPRDDIPSVERALNFGSVYIVQWGAYIVHQNRTIREEGSFKNWLRNPWHPHFDKDSFDYNLIAHTVVGNYYYLFYRSRGYDELDSLFWSILSSLAFEFTIETVTEPPSIQDIYQTPVLGSLLGMGAERLSNYLHSQEVWPARALGYLLNPFTLLPFSRYGFRAAPIVGKEQLGAALSLRF